MTTLRQEALQLAAIVAKALQDDRAYLWRKRHHPNSYHWADGPCFYAARAIACVDGYRGEIMEVSAGAHAVYVLGGIAMDGNGVYRLSGPLSDPDKLRPLNYHFDKARKRHPRKRERDLWPINWRRWYHHVRAPQTLVRVIREEAKRCRYRHHKARESTSSGPPSSAACGRNGPRGRSRTTRVRRAPRYRRSKRARRSCS